MANRRARFTTSKGTFQVELDEDTRRRLEALGYIE